MVGETEDRALEVADDVEVGRFRRQDHGGGGEGGLAIEAGTAQAGAGKKVSDRFQDVVWYVEESYHRPSGDLMI